MIEILTEASNQDFLLDAKPEVNKSLQENFSHTTMAFYTVSICLSKSFHIFTESAPLF